MTKAKSYAISKQLVWEAYKRVKANRGAAGVDGQLSTLTLFEGGVLTVFEGHREGGSLERSVEETRRPQGRGAAGGA